MNTFRATILALCFDLFAPALYAVELADLPDCHALTAADGKHRMGLVSPSANPELEVRLWELGLFYQDLAVCRESWDRALPSALPWAPVPDLEKYYGWAVFAAALILTLLLTTLLPRAWRRNLTLLGLIGILGGTWLLGAGGLALARSLGLPQQYLFEELVLFQSGDGEEQWLEVGGVWELDRALMARDVKPDLAFPTLRVQVRQGTDLALAERPGGVPLAADEPVPDDLVTTGRLEVVEGERFVEVTERAPVEEKQDVESPAPDQKEGPTLAGPETPDQADGPAVSPVPEVKTEAEPAGQKTYWVASDTLDLAPAILDPVDKTFRVHRPLNIRGSAGVQHGKLPQSPLHRGTRVEVLATHGDWWKVKLEGTDTEGWVSSLWLRRVED